MPLLAQILIFSVLSGVLSLIGGVALLGKRDWVNKFSIHFVSFAVGALLSVAFLDLLPEAIEASENIEGLFAIVLGGMVAFFIIEGVVLKFHPHHHEDTQDHHHATPILMNIGDGIHNFVDGVAIAVAFLAGHELGILTALAVAAHELPQEISDFSIMLHHGWPKRKVFRVNFIVSLTNVAGATMAYLARDFITPVLPYILALTAGIFIYIASADLLPEISHGKQSDKTLHVISLMILGIVSVWALSRYLGV